MSKYKFPGIFYLLDYSISVVSDAVHYFNGFAEKFSKQKINLLCAKIVSRSIADIVKVSGEHNCNKTRKIAHDKSLHNKQRLSISGIGQPVPGMGRPPQAISSPLSRHMITCYVRYQGSKCTVIYTRINHHKCPSQTRGRQEETHCPSHRFRCLLLCLL